MTSRKRDCIKKGFPKVCIGSSTGGLDGYAFLLKRISVFCTVASNIPFMRPMANNRYSALAAKALAPAKVPLYL